MKNIGTRAVRICFATLSALAVTMTSAKPAMSELSFLALETQREIDDAYQADRALYSQRIQELLHLLAVRAAPRARSTLLSVPVRIVNRGRAEAFSTGGKVYIDIALLDLLTHFADELSLANVREDAYHIMEFNLAYAAGLDGDKTLPLLDAYNTRELDQAQWQYLWREKQNVEKVIFDNILGFVIAHEMSHILLDHEREMLTAFPDENARHAENMTWVQARRTTELEADEVAARLCLNALVQPAQLLPWLDLNETRRRYYGKSREYPTTAQRIEMVSRAYRDIVGVAPDEPDLNEFRPLPPDRDVLKNDVRLFLDEFRKVRRFRQELLAWLDQTMTELLDNDVTPGDVGVLLYDFVEQRRELLSGAHDNSRLDAAIAAAESGATGGAINFDTLGEDLQTAGIGDRAMVLVSSLLDAPPVNWEELLVLLRTLRQAPLQFADGLDYTYFLANTHLRWQPDVFRALQAALPETENKARGLPPYLLGQPLRATPPTFAQRLRVLRAWDGKYLEQPDGN